MQLLVVGWFEGSKTYCHSPKVSILAGFYSHPLFLFVLFQFFVGLGAHVILCTTTRVLLCVKIDLKMFQKNDGMLQDEQPYKDTTEITDMLSVQSKLQHMTENYLKDHDVHQGPETFDMSEIF